MSHQKQKGFTLIEMLVVLGVVLIVILLAFPVIIGQAEKGRSAACVAKLRQLAVVMIQFRTERNQRMWDLKSVADGGEGGVAPAVAFYRHGLIRSGKEMCCPSATTIGKKAWKTGGSGSPDYMNNIANELVSYSVNGLAFYHFSPWRTSIIVTSFQYYSGHESQTPVFMDGIAFQLNRTAWEFPLRFSRLDLRHQNRCHVMFMDGHVEALDRQGVGQLDPNGGKNPAWLTEFGMVD